MPPARPHVVIVVADDMGYSDLGCYGGEMATPTLDRLARAGARLTRFYNTTRCDVDRAELVNHAKTRLEVVAELSAAWSAWASRVGVIPWERVQAIYRRDGKGDPTG